VFGGTTPEVDAILQSGIENGYRQFIIRVATARKMTPERVNEIAQGRVWVGGTAHQLGLVDRFGTIDDAIAEAARRAKLDPKQVHAEYLEKKPNAFQTLLADLMRKNDDDDASDASGDAFARIAAGQRAMLAQAVGDVRRLAAGGSIQARCLECGGFAPAHATAGDTRLVDLLMARIGL
jgi:protease-4